MKSRVLLAGLVATALCVMANPVLAKQCIWNKAGFVLDVSWETYNGRRIRFDRIATAQGTCLNARIPFRAVLSVAGGSFATTATKAAIIGGFAMLGAGTGKLYGVGLAGAEGKFISDLIPPARGRFWAGTPPMNRYVDVWGTIWSPQVGLGGRFR